MSNQFAHFPAQPLGPGFRGRLAASILVLALGTTACQTESRTQTPVLKIPVGAELVEATTFHGGVDLYGKLVPTATFPLLIPSDGTIHYPASAASSAAGLRVGGVVDRSELVFSVRNPERTLALNDATLAVEAAEAELDVNQQLHNEGLVSTRELERSEIQLRSAAERLQTAREQGRELSVRAPFRAQIAVEQALPEGSRVRAGQQVGELTSLGTSNIEAFATGADLERIKIGLEVEVRVNKSGPVLAAGRVMEVAQRLEGGRARILARVVEDFGLPPLGEGVEITVKFEERPDAVHVPESAIALAGGAPSVFLLEAAGDAHRARRAVVQLGDRRDGRIVLLSGVEEGDLVATSGVELLTDGALAAVASQP